MYRLHRRHRQRLPLPVGICFASKTKTDAREHNTKMHIVVVARTKIDYQRDRRGIISQQALLRTGRAFQKPRKSPPIDPSNTERKRKRRQEGSSWEGWPLGQLTNLGHPINTRKRNSAACDLFCVCLNSPSFCYYCSEVYSSMLTALQITNN